MVQEGLGGVSEKEFWPLSPTQMLPYFEEDLLLDFYKRLQELKKMGYSKEKLASLFPNRSILNNILVNNACIGFKVLDNLKILKTNFREREDFFEDIFDLIQIKDSNFLKKEGRNCLSDREIREFLKNKRIPFSKETQKAIGYFKVSLFVLNWSYFYDVFAVFGHYLHGPYSVNLNGKKYFLEFTEYYNQRPVTIWPRAVKSPCEKITIAAFRKKKGSSPLLFERTKTLESPNEGVAFWTILIDGKCITSINELDKIANKIDELSPIQSEFVSKLKPLEQTSKAILMNYWVLKDFFGKDWQKLYLKTNKNVKIFGDKFIKKSDKTPSNLSKSQVRQKFDPRNNKWKF